MFNTSCGYRKRNNDNIVFRRLLSNDQDVLTLEDTNANAHSNPSSCHINRPKKGVYFCQNPKALEHSIRLELPTSIDHIVHGVTAGT